LVAIRALYLFCLLAFFLGALEDLVDDVRTEIDDVGPDGGDGGKVAVGGRDDVGTEVGVGGRDDVGAEVGAGGEEVGAEVGVGGEDVGAEVGVGGDDVGAEVGVGGRDDEVAEGGDG
jgi:hypothetical protein